MATTKNGSPDFRTSDLYFAAYLQTAGVEMKSTERLESKVFFIFDTSLANIEELKAAWFNNTGKVAANPYAHCIKTLKSVCHMR